MVKAKSFISTFFTLNNLLRCCSMIIGLIALFFLSQRNFLLFHCIIEGFSIVVAFSIFLFAWNTRRMLNDNFFVLVGIAFLFVGILDFFHTLAYRGMNIFDISGGNVATQLWIGTRYVQSLSILATAFLINRKVRPALAFFTYTAVTVILLLSVFQWQVFPVCFIEGSGLTPFKIISEYCISFIVLVSIIVIWKKREIFDSRIAVIIITSLSLMILSEMAFTLYRDVYGILNVIGHILKLVSFYLLYVAIVESGLKNPLSVLFRELKKGNESLQEQIRLRRESEAQYRASLDNSPISIHVYSKKRELVFVNKTDLARNGYASLEEFKSIPVEKKLTPDSVAMVRQWEKDVAFGKPLPDSFYLDTITKNGEIRNLRALR
ncbi:MAG: hypothetical protein GX631_08380, partial [Dehalococcoidales bacterium]|nr:hypothetical protein [Dehalococcoidales bacterium]